jgi:pyridoxine 4-dehydrogenase
VLRTEVELGVNHIDTADAYGPVTDALTPQSDVLESVAKRPGATPTAVARSWPLQHSPNIMLIPGPSSVAYLRENNAGAALTLPADAAAELDTIVNDRSSI